MFIDNADPSRKRLAKPWLYKPSIKNTLPHKISPPRKNVILSLVNPGSRGFSKAATLPKIHHCGKLGQKNIYLITSDRSFETTVPSSVHLARQRLRHVACAKIGVQVTSGQKGQGQCEMDRNGLIDGCGCKKFCTTEVPGDVPRDA